MSADLPAALADGLRLEDGNDAKLQQQLHHGPPAELEQPAAKPPTAAAAGPADLRQLTAIVSKELQTHGRNVDKAVIRAAMEGYSGKDWRTYAFFEPERAYTRNLIATDHETFTLMLLCWSPGKYSPVHDHAGSHCFMRTISENSVEERRYAEPGARKEDPLQLTQITELKQGQVAYICDEIGLHAVGNPSPDRFAVTLHLYMPPYDSCKCFLDLTGEGCESYITFFSENGELVQFGAEGPPASPGLCWSGQMPEVPALPASDEDAHFSLGTPALSAAPAAASAAAEAAVGAEVKADAARP